MEVHHALERLGEEDGSKGLTGGGGTVHRGWGKVEMRAAR
jgi:hypothetical protein